MEDEDALEGAAVLGGSPAITAAEGGLLQVAEELRQGEAVRPGRAALVVEHADQPRGLEEVEKATRSLEAFESGVSTVVESAGSPAALGQEARDLAPGSRPMVARLAFKVIQTFPAHEPFGASKVSQEIDARYREALGKRVDPRLVAVALRRMAAANKIHQVRPGRPRWEALYTRER